jgi:hypothetical protein
MKTPVDGRLRSDGVALVVQYVAKAAAIPVNGVQSQAASGQEWLIVDLKIQKFDGPLQPPTLALGIGDRLKAIDNWLPQSPVGETTLAVSVAAKPDDRLVLRQSNVSQAFSLLSLARVGDSPAVLYADPIAPSFTQTMGNVSPLAKFTGYSGDFEDQLVVPQATFGYFSAGVRQTPSASTDMIVTIETAAVGGMAGCSLKRAPIDKFTLALADGTEVRPLDGVPLGGCDELKYSLSFEVPVSTTTATLHLAPFPDQGGDFHPLTEQISIVLTFPQIK